MKPLYHIHQQSAAKNCTRVSSTRQGRTPWVIWVHSHGRVAEHGLRPRCGHHDLASAVLQRICKRGEHAKHHLLVIPRHRQLGVLGNVDVVHLSVQHQPCECHILKVEHFLHIKDGMRRMCCAERLNCYLQDCEVLASTEIP